MSTGDPMIEATGITRTFGSVDALSSVSLSVERGTVLGLLGHNGAGKTTLVNILTTTLPASSGTARVAGFAVARDGGEVRSRIGLTGQFASVDQELTRRGAPSDDLDMARAAPRGVRARSGPGAPSRW